MVETGVRRWLDRDFVLAFIDELEKKRPIGPWRITLTAAFKSLGFPARRDGGLEPVSADIRTGLCSLVGIPPGKSLVRPETGAAFSAAPADCRRQRPRYFAFPAAKPRKVKDYSDGARKRNCAGLRGVCLFIRHAARPSTPTESPLSAGAGLRLPIKQDSSIMSFRMRRNAR
jgi:hypothetical protein